MAESPELRAWWSSHGANVEPSSKSCAPPANTWATRSWSPASQAPTASRRLPVFLAEVEARRLCRVPEAAASAGRSRWKTRNGLVAFGPTRRGAGARRSARFADRRFKGTPFYARITESYQQRRRPAACAPTLPRCGPHQAIAGGVRYFIAEQKEVNNQMEARAALGFEGRAPGSPPGWPTPRPWARSITSRPRPPSSPRSW